MTTDSLRTRMLRGDILSGTFVKTPSHDIIEVMALSGLDYVTIDTEHAPFDRGRLDACLAVARALNFPVLVRVPVGDREEILKVLDSGATGVVVPHVDTVDKAKQVAQWARFGHGGRGFAGSTRWAGYATRKMPEILAQSEQETIVVVQIEEPEAVDVCEGIASVNGVDGLFVGPADLAVCYGVTDINDKLVRDAISKVGKAVSNNDCCSITFAPNTSTVAELNKLGVTMFHIASEHGFAMAGARQVAEALAALDKK